MDIPDLEIQNIVNNMQETLNSKSLSDYEPIIVNFSQSQRMQFFILVKELNIDIPDFFPVELAIWKKFNCLFRNEYTDTQCLLQNMDITLNLAETALSMNVFDLEDFRSIVRFLYVNTKDITNLIVEITKILIRYLSNQGIRNHVLYELNSHLRFIGIPFISSVEIKNELLKLFYENKSEIIDFFDLPIGICQQYPEYIEEISEQLNYDKDVPKLNKWLDHESLSCIEKNKISYFIKSWKIKSKEPNTKFLQNLESEIRKNDLTSIPLVYNSFVKPLSSFIIPKKVELKKIKSNVPSEVLQRYIEKLAYPVSHHKDKKIKITFLGGAQIGNTGILISTQESRILIDYGLSIANFHIPLWHDALNYLDAIFITHGHLDHIGAIPYLFAIGYNGHVFGSKITKKLSNFLLMDNYDLITKNFSNQIRTKDFRFKYFSESKYIYQMLDHFVDINTKEEYQITPDVVVKPYPAHHIQGSLAFLIIYDNKKILVTGDLNLDSTALFGNSPPKFPLDSDLTIIDGTYYGESGFDFKKRDEILIQTVKEDKRIIIPAFSIGRAQELMMKLENLGMTKKRKISMLGMATKVAQSTGLKVSGHLSNKLIPPFEDEIIITGGGMASGGISRELIEQTKNDPDTTILLCGFLAKNTLGYRLLHGLEPQYKQKVVFTRFSGHTSNETLIKFLKSLKEKKSLVHLGNLTTEPLRSVKNHQKIITSRTDCYIPLLGSTLTI